MLAGACSTICCEGRDVAPLPVPASVEINFVRDIRPILENSCIKCHGESKPKSGFRMTSREGVMHGGWNGVDVVPGDSANSSLIHYVARQVPDMEMPPDGKGTPLTTEEVALLRAWIDQDLPWDEGSARPSVNFDITPLAGWTAISGDDSKFRQINGQTGGWFGGAEAFESTEKLSPDSRVNIAGHALLNDYLIGITLEKTDVGFTRFGWEQYRKYYDDSGGYAPPLPVFDLARDLYLDIGRAWVDFGLTRPNWPQVTLGYEYQYRDGTKSTLAWGATPSVTNNILPAYKDVAEHTHVIKLDAADDIAGVHLENSFRGEFYSLTAKSFSDVYYDGSGTDSWPTGEKEKVCYFQGANALTLERRFTSWFFASGGYYYSKLDGDSSVNLDTSAWSTVPASITDVNFNRESHVVSGSALLGSLKGFSLTAAVQSDWTQQSGSGNANAEFYDPIDVFETPGSIRSDLDRTTTEERIALRYTGVPYTTLYAEGQLQQECIGQNESETADYGEFQRKTDATSNFERCRVGFSSSPWRSVSWSTYYQIEDRCVDYNHPTDDLPLYGDGEGYSAFITARNMSSCEFLTKVTLRPCNWLNATLSYKQIDADYHTTTEAAPIVSYPGGRFPSYYDARIYSVSAVLTPWRKLYLSTTFSYRDTRTKTITGPDLPVVPYKGDVYSVVNSGTWTLNKSTHLITSYAFALADYSQSDAPDAVRFGAQYEQHAARIGLKHKFSAKASCGVEYGYYHYDEPSSGGHNDYSAHSVFVSVSYRLP